MGGGTKPWYPCPSHQGASHLQHSGSVAPLQVWVVLLQATGTREGRWGSEPKVDQTASSARRTASAWPVWCILGRRREEPSWWTVFLCRGLSWGWRKALDWSGKTLLGSASAVCRHINAHSSSARFRSVMVGRLRGHCVLSQKQNAGSCFWVRTSLLWSFQQTILSLISFFIF